MVHKFDNSSVNNMRDIQEMVNAKERIYDRKYINEEGDSMKGNLELNNYRITNLGDPENETDAVNKKYLDKILRFEIEKIKKYFEKEISETNKNLRISTYISSARSDLMKENKQSINKLDSLCKSLITLVNDNKKINEKEIKLISEKFKSLKFIEGKTEVEFIEIMKKKLGIQSGGELEKKWDNLLKNTNDIKKLKEAINDLKKSNEEYRKKYENKESSKTKSDKIFL